MTFEEIYTIRKSLYDAIKQNKTGVLRIVTELYSESTHFIYEILQNAEDAGATKISFSLFPEKLVINHNGRSFDIEDISGITNIAGEDNNKRTDQDKIGKFGIGFKSVYAITNLPQIKSGIYDFKIKDFLLPELMSDNNNFEDTCIILPFYNNQKTTEQIYGLLEKKLERLEYFNLLFLKNLKEIKIEIDNSSRIIYKEENSLTSKKNNIAFECIIYSDGIPHHYLHFKKEVKHPSFASLKNKPKLSIAFKKDFIEGVPYISIAESSKLFVFFETGYETFLKFMIHAPFNTTPSRDNINFQEQTNIELLDELDELFKDALEYFSTNKHIDVNLLNHLPIDSSRNKNEIVYQKFYETLKEEFLSEKKYLPANDGSLLASRSKVGLIRGKELKQILASKNDLQKLFKIDYWINSEITIDKTPQLRNYLMKELSIKEYGPEDFARVVTKDFFESKPNTWIRSFYGFLNKQQSLYATGRGRDVGVLRKKPIIRLLNGKHTEPFDINGKPKVFLSSDKKKMTYDIIHPEVISNKPSLEFIKEKLGIKEPNYVDQIRQQIIPLYNVDAKTKVNVKKHLEHIQFILEIYSKGSETVKTELIEMISADDIYLFYVYDFKTSDNYWGRARDCYIENKMLKEYFRFTEKVYFLNDNIYTSISLDILHNLALKCGAKNYPGLVEVKTNLSPEKKKQLRIASYGTDDITTYHGETITDYSLFGFDDIMKQEVISKSDSLLLWQMLLNFLKEDPHKYELFRGNYWWFRNQNRNAHFTSQILLNLRNNSWLYSKENVCISPNQITLSLLAQEYNLDTDEAVFLVNKLQFKEEAVQLLLNQLSPEKKELFNLFEAAQKLCNEKGGNMMAALTLIMTEANREAEKLELENAPDVDDIETVEDDFIPFDDSNVEGKEVDNNSSGNSDDTSQEPPKPKVPLGNQQSQQMKNEIGERGEFLAMKHLKKLWSRKATLVGETETVLEFEDANKGIITISLLNTENKKGIGCDIIITKGEEQIEFIEVKSTKMKDKVYFPVNVYQWSLAHKKYKLGEGKKYSFIVVKNVLCNEAPITIINNPIKKWKDGELRAHPVNLEL